MLSSYQIKQSFPALFRHVEDKVIRGSGNATPFWLLTSETPSTRSLGL
jgi:hypothetical protein